MTKAELIIEIDRIVNAGNDGAEKVQLIKDLIKPFQRSKEEMQADEIAELKRIIEEMKRKEKPPFNPLPPFIRPYPRWPWDNNSWMC